MKEFFGCLVDWFYIIILVVLLLFLLCISFFAIYLKCSKVEIDRYFINSEITHCDYSNSKQGLGMRDVKYIVAVRNKEFACTFEVSSTDYAKYKEGDFVNVEVVVFEDKIGRQNREYKLLE